MANKRVLIVDDDYALLLPLHEYLMKSGVEVISAATTEEAMKEFDEHKDELGVVVMDMMLPASYVETGTGLASTHAGLELIKRFKAVTPLIRVIVWTGSADSSIERAAHELGVSDYVRKPASAHDLLIAIRRALKDRDAANPSSGDAV